VDAYGNFHCEDIKTNSLRIRSRHARHAEQHRQTQPELIREAKASEACDVCGGWLRL
jgi:hypothetical protein